MECEGRGKFSRGVPSTRRQERFGRETEARASAVAFVGTSARNRAGKFGSHWQKKAAALPPENNSGAHAAFPATTATTGTPPGHGYHMHSRLWSSGGG